MLVTGVKQEQGAFAPSFKKTTYAGLFFLF
jgi:hypothetical protein